MIEVRYISSNKKEYNLIGDRMRPTDGSFHAYEWTPEIVGRKIGETVTGFTKASKTYQITLTIRGKLEDRKALIDDLTDSFEYDIVNVSPGRIYFGDWYIDCYIKDKTTGISGTWNNWTELALGVYCPYPQWIKEASRSFLKIRGSGGTEEYLDYEYDYEYDYSTPTDGSAIWEVDHFAPCEFLMTIFGPVSNPRILINGYSYEVYTELGSNDYLQIDSRNNKVIKYLSNGTRQDMYNYRAKQQSIFEPITPGNITVMWPGTYGFDLTLFCERSEPKWKMKSS